MNMEPGLIVVIAATLIFYLRLTILQREQMKRIRAQYAQNARASTKKKKPLSAPAPRYSIISRNSRDWVIAGLGLLAILLGILVKREILFPALYALWWLPTALGILAMNWAFRLS